MKGKNAQATLEYMILVGMIIFIGVVIAAMVYTYFLNPHQEKIPVEKDKYNCQFGNPNKVGFERVELVNYNEPYDGTDTTKPQAFRWGNALFEHDGVSSTAPGPNETVGEVCKLQGKYSVILNTRGRTIYLQTKTGQYYVYKPRGGGGSTTTTEIKLTPIAVYGNDRSPPTSGLCTPDEEVYCDAGSEIQLKFGIVGNLPPGKSRSDITNIKLIINQVACTADCGANDGIIGQIDPGSFGIDSATIKNQKHFDLSSPQLNMVIPLDNLLSNVSDPATGNQNLIIAIKKDTGNLGYVYYCKSGQDGPYLNITVS